MTGQTNRPSVLSRALFAAAFFTLGVFYLVCGDSSFMLQAMPHWIPWRAAWIAWIYASGVVMLACGAGLLVGRTAVTASRVLLAYLLLWLLLLKVPVLAHAPLAIGSWETFAETATLVSGAWVLVASLSGPGRNSWLKIVRGDNGIRWARILFGIALVLFGLAHFGYLKYTASLVPAWLPWHLGWVCLTGAGYMAAGLGTVFRVYPRLAAVLTAGMMSLFQLLIWVPRVIAAPTVQDYWSELLIGWALVFGAWVIADSYRGVAWLAVRKLSRTATSPGNSTTC